MAIIIREDNPKHQQKILHTSRALKKLGDLPSRSSFPRTAWKMRGKFFFGKYSQLQRDVT